jgi:hypothetical protein
MNLDSSSRGEKAFQRINDKFRQYWKCLLVLTVVYICAYLLWSKGISIWVLALLKKNEWNSKDRFLIITVAIIQGLLFSLDGFVTSLLKSPFQQMCYAVNMTKEISNQDKDYIITRATESNEHCKETLKKFGILTITGELLGVFIEQVNLTEAAKKKNGLHANWLNLSYLIPLIFSGFAIFLIYRRLKKTEKKIKKFST